MSILNKLNSYFYNTKKLQKIGLANSPTIITKSRKSIKQNFVTAVNIITPIIAVAGFVCTVHYWSNVNYGITLSYDGVELGTVQNETVYDNATDLLNEKIDANGLHITPTYSLAIINDNNVNSSDEVCNNLIAAYQNIESATGFYLDGELICVAKNENDIQEIINEILNSEAENFENATAELINDYKFINGLYNKNDILDKDRIKELLLSNVTELEFYTVENGDTLESIAQKNNLTVLELLSLNTDLTENTILKENQNIVVSVENKRLHIKVISEVSYNVVIPFKTITQKDNTKFNDYSTITFPGAVGNTTKTDAIIYVDGVETERENISSVVTQEAMDKIITVGTLERTYGTASGTFIWPVPSTKYVSSGYGYRWNAQHKGVDIAGVNIYGSDIVASDGGTVKYVKLHNYGYGYHLLIDHGNGYQTLYAHCSQIYVQAGQQVYAGQPIAAVGSTGDSTGPHLHFEIIYNGINYNPLSYVS